MPAAITVLTFILISWCALAPFAIPAAARLCRTSGLSARWAALLLIPYVGLVALLALLARRTSPRLDRAVHNPAIAGGRA